LVFLALEPGFVWIRLGKPPDRSLLRRERSVRGASAFIGRLLKPLQAREQPVYGEANPEVYRQSPIDLERLVLRAGRKVSPEAEINGIAG